MSTKTQERILQWGVRAFKMFGESRNCYVEHNGFPILLNAPTHKDPLLEGRVWCAAYTTKNNDCYWEQWGSEDGPMLGVELIEKLATDVLKNNPRVTKLHWIEPVAAKRLWL